MPASWAASSRGKPSRALASVSSRALTRPSRSRRASRRSSAGLRSARIGNNMGVTASPGRVAAQRPMPEPGPSPLRQAGTTRVTTNTGTTAGNAACGIRPRLTRRGMASGERLERCRRVVEHTSAWLARFRRVADYHERWAHPHIALTTFTCAIICLRQVERSTSVTPIEATASATFWPCATRTSTWRSLATISSGVVPLHLARHPVLRAVQRHTSGWTTSVGAAQRLQATCALYELRLRTYLDSWPSCAQGGKKGHYVRHGG
jgi:hypothetical protein